MGLFVKLRVLQQSFCLVLIFLLTGSFSLLSQNETIERTGDVLLIALPVAAVTTSILKNDKKGSWQYSKGLLLTGVISYGLKLGIHKMRPDFSNENSFPSGHTSITFQSAAFVHKRYSFKESIPFYALAGFTAFSRIHAEKHDGWDVLAGAIVGIGSSYLFTTSQKKEELKLSFTKVGNNYFIGFNYKF